MNDPNDTTAFDINGPGLEGKLFGLPYTPENAKVVIVPVPWETTVTYKAGTANGPAAILKASRQVDFFMRDIPDAWQLGVSMEPISKELKIESDRLRLLVEQVRANDGSTVIASKINEASESLNIFIKKTTELLLNLGKIVGILGGDHSTPLGL